MQHSEFVHLHVHSEYSLLDGAAQLEKLVQRAKDLRFPAIALTDHGNLFGAIDFYLAAQKAGVKPIVGCELYVALVAAVLRAAPATGTSSSWSRRLTSRASTTSPGWTGSSSPSTPTGSSSFRDVSTPRSRAS